MKITKSIHLLRMLTNVKLLITIRLIMMMLMLIIILLLIIWASILIMELQAAWVITATVTAEVSIEIVTLDKYDIQQRYLTQLLFPRWQWKMNYWTTTIPLTMILIIIMKCSNVRVKLWMAKITKVKHSMLPYNCQMTYQHFPKTEKILIKSYLQ